MECHVIGDQKLKLIDISSEDEFLIDSPLFDSLEDLRLSVTLDSINENGEGSNLSKTSAKIDKSTQVNKQKELKHLSSASIQPGRPSYLRKSSAWDNAFFTSAGLLDPHELSSMNKEFDTLENHLLPVILEDVCARRPDQQSISNIRTGTRNMIDRSLVFKRKNINDARPERIKTQTSAYASKHGETGKTKLSSSVSSTKTQIRSSSKSKKFENLSSYHKSPPRTTKAWSLESSLSTSSTNRAHTDSNRCLLLPRSQLTGPVASVPRENPQPSGLCMPSPKFGFFDEDMSTFDGNSNQPQKQGISASIDEGKSAEASIKVKRARSPLSIDSVNRDSMITILVLSPIKSRYAVSIPKAKDASNARKDIFDVQSKYQTDKSIEIDRKVCSKLRKVGAGEHDRKRVGLVNGIVKTKEKREKIVTKDDKAINIRTTITPQSQTSQGRLYESSLSMSLNLTPSRDKGITSTSKSTRQENEVNDLSRYLEVIDLNDETETQVKQNKSFPHMRTPLVEKKSVCNRSVALMRSDMVKDNKESANLLSSKGTDKENN
uniref:Uncharacterized protein n=1 Tax=Solanum tuberosum TaxID=4113 RepID=M0ZQ05_SOLTU